MAKNKRDIIAGLDLGTTKICALIGEVDEQQNLTIIGEGMVPSEGFKNGMVVDLEAATKAIEKAVSKAESTANIHIDRIVVSMAGKHIQSQNNRGEISVANPLRGITEEDIKHVMEKAQAVVIPEGREL